MQPLVDAAVADQLFVRSEFRDASLIEDHDLVGAPDCRQAVRDYDYGAIADQGLKRALHQDFRFAIQMRRSFVQNQDWGILEQSPRDGQPLPLPAA